MGITSDDRERVGYEVKKVLTTCSELCADVSRGTRHGRGEESLNREVKEIPEAHHRNISLSCRLQRRFHRRLSLS